MTIRPLTGMNPAAILTGAELFYAQQVGTDVKVTANQFAPIHYLAANYGVKADGVTDDTAALQAAFNAVIATGGTLELPRGIMIVTSTVSLAPVSPASLNVIGQGGGQSVTIGTKFVWKGASTTTPMFRLNNISRSLFQGFFIFASAAFPLAVGIQSEAGATGSTGTNAYRDIFINGTTNAIDKGFAFVQGAGGIDSGNDTSVFDRVEVDNFATAAWSFEHGQSKSHCFYGCRYSGSGGGGLYGVATALGASQEGGSFVFLGGGGNFAAGADFYIGQPNDVIAIFGGNFENSNRFVDSPSAIWNSGPGPVVLTSNRWAGSNLNADGFVINYWSGGTLVLVGNIIGSDATRALKVFQAGGPSYGISIGNYYASTDPNVLVGLANQPFHWQSFMDFRNNNGTRGVLVSEQIVNQQIYSTNSSVSASTLLTGANIFGGSIEHVLNLTGAISAASNAQLPTVANLLVAIGGLFQINQTFKLRIINGGGSGSGVWTVTTNTGWTLNGTMTIAVGAWREFIVTLTAPATPTATLQSVGAGNV